eukprot:7893611-Lingulodinium_polyedra.AAC.1
MCIRDRVSPAPAASTTRSCGRRWAGDGGAGRGTNRPRAPRETRPWRLWPAPCRTRPPTLLPSPGASWGIAAAPRGP